MIKNNCRTQPWLYAITIPFFIIKCGISSLKIIIKIHHQCINTPFIIVYYKSSISMFFKMTSFLIFAKSKARIDASHNPNSFSPYTKRFLILKIFLCKMGQQSLPQNVSKLFRERQYSFATSIVRFILSRNRVVFILFSHFY